MHVPGCYGCEELLTCPRHGRRSRAEVVADLRQTAASYREKAERAKRVNTHDRPFYLRAAEQHELRRFLDARESSPKLPRESFVGPGGTEIRVGDFPIMRLEVGAKNAALVLEVQGDAVRHPEGGWISIEALHRALDHAQQQWALQAELRTRQGT